jgi:2-polyprenyl-6-methoxyphenol hydroxylase-like FAD-dependent oxidoreductase
VSHPEGWYWIIPLRDDVYSVGFVTHKSRFVERRGDYSSDEQLLLDIIDESDTVKDLIAHGEFQGKTRIEPDYSYVADSFCGPGYFIVGDAACFLDPLLSTGVHLALYSGTLAAASVIATARGDISELEAQGFYESRYRNAYARLLVLVSGVYEQYRGKDNYFWLAQRLVRDRERPIERSNKAFVEIVAGLTDVHDATTGGSDGVRELIEEAEEVALGSKRSDGEGHGDAPFAPLRIEPSDLYDAGSGLYLVTTPELGIGRTAAVEQEAPA